MKTRWKILLVIGGYIAAAAIASTALALRLAMTRGPDVQAMSGMYAFGDTALFLSVFFVAALVPTAAAFFFLRRHHLLWIVVSVVAMAVAASGVVAAILYLTARSADPHTALGTWAGLAPLRMLAAPLFALAFFVVALLSPDRGPRTVLFLAALCEVGISAYTGFVFFNPFTLH